MEKYTRSPEPPLFVGMDVHKATIVVCAFDSGTGEIVDERKLPNDWPKIRKYIERVQKRYGTVECCYEASSCGFALYRELRAMDVHCDVIVPSLIPAATGSRRITGTHESWPPYTLRGC